MTLSDLSKSIRLRLALPLPGQEAQFMMAHAERRNNLLKYKIRDDHRKSAVLLLFYESHGEIRFPLIIRPVYDGVHSGQVALPGGSMDPGDANLEATAVREACEETGVKKENIKVLGELSELYIPPSNFLVRPFVAVYDGVPEFNPQEREVARIIEMKVEKILDEQFIGEKSIKLNTGLTVNMPCYEIDHIVIWGATAMILSEMKAVLFEIGA